MCSSITVQKLKDLFLGWFMGLAEYSSLIHIFISDSKSEQDWQDYIEEEHRLSCALKSSPEVMYLVTGPRASGKSDLIRDVYSKLP